MTGLIDCFKSAAQCAVRAVALAAVRAARFDQFGR